MSKNKTNGVRRLKVTMNELVYKKMYKPSVIVIENLDEDVAFNVNDLIIDILKILSTKISGELVSELLYYKSVKRGIIYYDGRAIKRWMFNYMFTKRVKPIIGQK